MGSRPAGLRGGPGDELIVAQIKTHASPPTGHNLTAWEVTRGTMNMVSKSSGIDVSNLLAHDADWMCALEITCAG